MHMSHNFHLHSFALFKFVCFLRHPQYIKNNFKTINYHDMAIMKDHANE